VAAETVGDRAPRLDRIQRLAPAPERRRWFCPDRRPIGKGFEEAFFASVEAFANPSHAVVHRRGGERHHTLGVTAPAKMAPQVLDEACAAPSV